jgi:hypothetical protein
VNARKVYFSLVVFSRRNGRSALFLLNFLRRHKLSSSMVKWRIKRVSNWQFHKENSPPKDAFAQRALLKEKRILAPLFYIQSVFYIVARAIF